MKLRLLYEGKKQALAILKDEELVNRILAIDPTKTKKYSELIARILKPKIQNFYKRGIDSATMVSTNLESFKTLVPLIKQAESEHKSIDLSQINDLLVLESVLEKAVNRSKGSLIATGIKGLTRGDDYEIIYNNPIIYAIIPFNFKSSKLLASEYVGNCRGKWCIAYDGDDDSYWKTHTQQKGQAPVYMIPKNEDEYKYAYMFHEDSNEYDIWDEEDNLMTNATKPIITNDLGISETDFNMIRDKALQLAVDNIDSFAKGEQEPSYTKLFNINFELTKFKFNGTLEITTEVYYPDEDDYGDPETEQYEECEGTVNYGPDYFTNGMEGFALLKSIYEEYKDLETLTDITDNSVIIDYGTDSTFGALYEEMSGLHYDDSNDNTSYQYIIKVLKNNDVSVLVILSQEENSPDEDEKEPMYRALRQMYGELDSFNGYSQEVGYYTIFSSKKNTSNLLDGVKSIPNLYRKLTSEEWYRDDTEEAKYGQQFIRTPFKKDENKKKYKLLRI